MYTSKIATCMCIAEALVCEFSLASSEVAAVVGTEPPTTEEYVVVVEEINFPVGNESRDIGIFTMLIIGKS